MGIRWNRDERPEYKRQITKLRELLSAVSKELGIKISERDATVSETRKARLEHESLETRIEQKKETLAKLDRDHQYHQGRIKDAIFEHSRIVTEHAEKTKDVRQESANAARDLGLLKKEQERFSGLSFDFDEIEKDIESLKKQREDIIAEFQSHAAGTVERTLELRRIENDIDQKIKENGRILRDISVVRSDLYIYAARLQKYYDEVGLKIKVDEIMDNRLGKNK